MSDLAFLPNATDFAPPVGRTLAARVFRQMRADILECRLPPGSKLRFDELRARYSVAVSPLREALTRLAEEGLVILEEHRGFKVSPVSRQKLHEIISTRREIDALTIRLSIERGDAAWEARVRASFVDLATGPITTNDGEMDSEWERSHAAFHAALHSGSGSMWLERLCALLFDQTTRYRRLWFKHLRGDLDVVAEHREIMDAVLARDVLAATYLMRRHTQLLVNPLLDLVPVANE
jgi:GntR family transcriptional regulator, carbon starvation induced regulator